MRVTGIRRLPRFLPLSYQAGLAVGTWANEDEIAASWRPRAVIEPSGKPVDRDRWRRAVGGARSWYPELTAPEF